MERFPAQLTVDDSTLVLDQTRLLVVFDEQMDREDVEEMLEPFDLRLEELDESRQGEGPTTPTIGSTVNHSPTSYWVRADEEIDEDVLEALDDERDVAYVSPVFGDPDDTRATSRFSLDPTVLLVRLDPDREDEDDTADRLSRLANEHGLMYDPADDEHLEPFHFLRLSDGADDGHVFDIRERLDDERDVHTVTYNTIPLASPLTQPEPVVPNDTHFADQWNMTQIEADVGWNLSTGDTSVVVGVIDFGCDMTHPDLAFDGTGGYNTQTMTNDGSPVSGNGHGTCVAGLAAARFDNNEGIAGVAGDCLIHAVALGRADFVGLARGINESRTVGVEVINMSIGWDFMPSATLRAPVDTALTNAAGDDIVMCASSGNDGNALVGGPLYPSVHDDVICVGASDENDERKRTASPDGECWASNWGDELDVVAPGVLCWAPDIQETGGYNSNDGGSISWACVNYASSGTADGDYFSVFDGTSAAAPHVSGLAALVRSLDPSLDRQQVRDIIERTCDKVSPGTYTYSTVPGRPNGTWNDEMGYGRINVYNALSEILSVELVTQPVSFVNVPEGQTTNAAVEFDVRSPESVEVRIAAGGGPTVDTGPGTFQVFDPPGTSDTVGPTGGMTTQAEIYVFHQAGPAGTTTTGSVTIECPRTNQTWDVSLTGTSVPRETSGVVLVLDHSGSMSSSSGVSTTTGGSTLSRMNLLQEAVEPFLNLLDVDDGVGAVGFSDDATTLTELRDAGQYAHPAHRRLTEDRIDMLSAGGMTSIGEGVILGSSLFDSPSAPDYTNESLVVFTDGHDNPATGRRELSHPDVQNAITERVFAVGMGTPAQLEPSTLTTLTNGSGGHLMMTGNLASDDRYRLQQYFLKILAGATNAETVLDPERRLPPGREHRIPFELTEADYSADVVVLTPQWGGLFDVAIETPDGDRIDPGTAGGSPEVTYVEDETTVLYRFQLPTVATGVPAHGGRWYAVVSVDEGQFREYVSQADIGRREREALGSVGVPYNVSVHARSNLQLRATLSQDSREPGADFTVRASLREYDLPVDSRATVEAQITYPDGGTTTLRLPENDPGVFEQSFSGKQPGTYQVLVSARGETLHGRRFTREELRVGGLWDGGDRPPRDRGTSDSDERLARFIECLEKQDVDPDVVRRCLRKYSGRSDEDSDDRDLPRIDRPSPDELERIVRDPRVFDAISSLSDAFRRR